MIQITKRTQFFYPGYDFYLSSFSSSDKSKIQYIIGLNTFGTIIKWDPNLFFPALAILRKDQSYLIRSNISSGSFAPYDLPIESGGQPEQDEHIVRTSQFLTYRGEYNFSFGQLSNDVKARILRISTEGPLSSSDLVTWRPEQLFPSFNSFVTGRTYLVESVVEGFAEYALGLPDPPPDSSLSFLDDAFLPDVGLIPSEYVGV